jgi:hypothetical protein
MTVRASLSFKGVERQDLAPLRQSKDLHGRIRVPWVAGQIAATAAGLAG